METNRTARRMALATAIAVALAPAAQAATFTVTTADDNGAGSLRAALEAANAASGADTVEFDTTFFSAGTPRTIVLATPLSITGEIIVAGPGAALAAIDGEENVQLLTILPTVPGAAVSIAGLTLQNGFSGSDGGCVRALGARLTLEDSVLTGCVAGEGTGGALLFADGVVPPPAPARKGVVEPASLTVRNTRFAGNRAFSGGAIAAQLTGSGGITLETVTMQGNEAREFAGGAVLSTMDGGIVLQDSTISGNLSGGIGGGVALGGSGDIRIEGTQFAGNRIEVPNYSYGAYTYGAGAAVIGFGDVLITGTSFENNAIVMEAPLPVRKGEVPLEDFIGTGGGLFVFPASAGNRVEVAASHFTGNGAGLGGGMTMGVPQSFGGQQPESGGFKRHLQAARGKALEGTNAIGETRFTGNIASFGGTGLALMDLQMPSRAKAVSPGMTLDRVTLSGNLLSPAGPGIVPGAIVMLGPVWPVQLINSTVSGNTGGIFAGSPMPAAPDEPVLLLDHSTVVGNDIGGIILSSVQTPGRKHGPLAKWAARMKDYPLPQVNIAIRNSVLAGNGDEAGEADLIADPGTVQMLHSLVQTTDPADFSGYQDDGGNQLGVDPLLAPLALAGHDFLEVHVPLPGSPLIDAGDPDVAASTPPAMDQRGVQRIAGAAIDIGAVETVSPGSIAFDPAAFTISETAGTATLTAVRSGGADGAVSVNFATVDGSALAGADYTAASGTLSWADGDDGPKSFEVALTDDALVETDETFTAALSDVAGGATLGTSSATVTLTSDDLPPVGTLALDATVLSVNETDGTATLGVSRSGGSFGAVTVDYATADAGATAGSDYTAAVGTLSWADGDTAVKNIVVTVLDDALVENPEDLQLTLSNATGGASLGAAGTTVTIVSEDVAPPGTLAIAPAALTVNEPDGTATLSVTRTGGSAGAVTVNYATANGTALAASDYTAAAGTLAWADGDTAAKSIVVPILDDAQVEADEQFSVTLAQPTGGASLGTTAAAVTIVSEDLAPTGSLQFDGAGADGMVTLRFNEDGTPAAPAKALVQIAVTRSGGSAGAASIDFATVDGTATAPADYTATSGTLSWADGEAGTKFIAVNIVEDGFGENDENFRIVLSNAQGAGLGINAQAQIVVVANGAASATTPITVPAGDTRSWLALIGAMLAAAWVGLRRRM